MYLLARVASDAFGQPLARVAKIGFLSSTDPPTAAQIEVAWEPLRELGWIDGQNLVFERRYASGRTDLLETFARELVRLDVALIVASGTDAAVAAKRATTSVPIVMTNVGDPVRSGLVSNLGRPEGNITGFSISAPEIDAKLLSLLRETLPSAQRVGVLVNPTNPIHDVRRKENENVYTALGMQPIFVEVSAANELESAVAGIARQGGQALVVFSDSLFLSNAASLMKTALRYELPAIVEGPDMLQAGGLLSYSADVAEQRRRVAVMIDKILRGAKPADLPVEQPTRFKLTINTKTANALGIAIPQSVRIRADE